VSNRAWRKSSYSGSEGNDCVELSVGVADTHVRDTKSRDAQLRFSRNAFAAFLRKIS
jgi:hypothetical protein